MVRMVVMNLQSKIVFDWVERIICLELETIPNFAAIKRISDEAIDFLNTTALDLEIDDRVYRFLEDYDVRQKDRKYAEGQIAQVREIISKRTER
jgi:hypothetical protein